MKILLLLLLIINTSFAGVLSKKNNKYFVTKKQFQIEELAKDYAQIKGYALIMDERVKGQFDVYGPRTFAQEDLDLFVTVALSDMGYTILRTDELKQLEVINARDIRYRGGQVFTDIDDVPRDYNFYQFVMKLNYAETHDISRNLRPFISRYGRVIEERNANTIILADTGTNIHRIQKLIKKLDTPAFLKRKELVDKINSQAKREVKESKPFLSFLKDQHVLFLISFALIGGIIGFGVRGYLMKRVEGGW